MSGGGPLGNWPLPRGQLEIAKKQARLVGCPEDTSENIVKCLRTVPVEKFNNAFLQFRVSKFLYFVFLCNSAKPISGIRPISSVGLVACN